MNIMPTITEQGFAALWRADASGLQLTLSHVALGDGTYTVTGQEIALKNECQRVAITEGSLLSSHEIALAICVQSDSAYWIGEIGLLLKDGTLFALWSNAKQPLAYKAPNVDLLLDCHLALEQLPSDAITFGDSVIQLPNHEETLITLLTSQINSNHRQLQLQNRLIKR